MDNHKDISVFEGASIISGLSIGGGVMAVPYFFVQNNWWLALVVIACALWLCAMINLMIAETAMRSNKDYQIVELFQEYVFKTAPAWVMWTVFILTIINFYLALLSFSSAATDILLDILPWPAMGVHAMVFLITAVPILFGLKTLAIGDKLAIGVILVIISIMTVMSFSGATETLRTETQDVASVLRLYSMASLAFIGLVSVPQIVTGMKRNRNQVPKAIYLGLVINLFLVVSVALSVSVTTGSVTEVAIIGWTKALGSTTQILGSLFVLLAIITSYWGTAYAAAIIYQQRIDMKYAFSWAAVVVPVFLITIFFNASFIELMQATAGLLAVMLIFSIVPMYRAAVANTPNYNGFTLGRFGNTIFQVLVILGFVLVIVGSLV